MNKDIRVGINQYDDRKTTEVTHSQHHVSEYPREYETSSWAIVDVVFPPLEDAWTQSGVASS